MRQSALETMRLSRSLKRAVKSREFFSYFQPLIDIDDERVMGFEALLRWGHPEKGVLTPGDFIEQAREQGLLQTIEKQVMKESCTVIKKNKRKTRPFSTA